MSEHSHEGRSPVALAGFGVAFLGFVLGAVGVVLNSVSLAVLGFLLMAVVLGGFLLGQALGE